MEKTHLNFDSLCISCLALGRGWEWTLPRSIQGASSLGATLGRLTYVTTSRQARLGFDSACQLRYCNLDDLRIVVPEQRVHATCPPPLTRMQL